MPTRSSRSRSVPAAISTSTPTQSHHILSRHACQLTILWVFVLSLSLAGWLVMISYMDRLDTQGRAIVLLNAKLQQLRENVAISVPPPADTIMPVSISPSVPPVGEAAMSPSGALHRGSLSPDGTKYAGYNDTVKGKIGLAVEVLVGSKVKYIEIFNPKAESTGSGTDMESTMSVRWLDNSKIEYDVLVTKADGHQAKETRTSSIFF